jgi:hypothetical protein
MSAAGKLFTPDGEIVVGERYRVDKEIVRDVPFDPNDRSTWGQGGTAPLLTYKQDFDSTHMLFFAGSGGFKTTSNVVPTALRYTGPLICLDPSTEVAPMVVEHRTRNARPRESWCSIRRTRSWGSTCSTGIETSRQKEEDIVGVSPYAAVGERALRILDRLLFPEPGAQSSDGAARPCHALAGICRAAEPAQPAPDRLRAGAVRARHAARHSGDIPPPPSSAKPWASSPT